MSLVAHTSAVENCSCLWSQEHGSDEAALRVVFCLLSIYLPYYLTYASFKTGKLNYLAFRLSKAKIMEVPPCSHEIQAHIEVCDAHELVFLCVQSVNYDSLILQ